MEHWEETYVVNDMRNNRKTTDPIKVVDFFICNLKAKTDRFNTYFTSIGDKQTNVLYVKLSSKAPFRPDMTDSLFFIQVFIVHEITELKKRSYPKTHLHVNCYQQ